MSRANTIVASILVLGASCCVASVVPNLGAVLGTPAMKTDIALVNGGSTPSNLKVGNTILIEPSNLVDKAALELANDDIEEDESDKFITSRSGKIRPMFHVGDEGEWAEDAQPIAPIMAKSSSLSRVKRCGRNDDDDNANRARRVRRNRARRARRAKARRARKAKSTTTVTRKVIKNGQVISETTEGQTVSQVNNQPPVIVQSVQPATVVSNPQVIQQPAQVVQVPQQPTVQQTQTINAPTGPGLPAVSVQGSVKVEG